MDDKALRAIEVFSSRMGINRDEVMKSATHKACATRYMIFSYLHNNLGVTGYKLAEYFGQTRINILRGIRILKGWMKFHHDIKLKYSDIIKEIEDAD